jgi:ABC-type amino acid transport system permease subunit
MNESATLDELFRSAVSAIDAGDINELGSSRLCEARLRRFVG